METGGEVGEAKDELDVEYEGEGVVVALNAYYLLDLLGTMDGDKAVMKMQDSLSPVLTQEPGDESLVSIVMPMRL